jgi:excisionase family DNA binding protein
VPKVTDWLAPAEAARRLGVGVATVRALADKGELEMNRTALGRLISSDSVEKRLKALEKVKS